MIVFLEVFHGPDDGRPLRRGRKNARLCSHRLEVCRWSVPRVPDRITRDGAQLGPAKLRQRQIPRSTSTRRIAPKESTVNNRLDDQLVSLSRGTNSLASGFESCRLNLRRFRVNVEDRPLGRRSNCDNDSVFFLQISEGGKLKLWWVPGSAERTLKSVQARKIIPDTPVGLQVRDIPIPFRLVWTRVDNGSRIYQGLTECDQIVARNRVRFRFILVWMCLFYLASPWSSSQLDPKRRHPKCLLGMSVILWMS